MELLGHAVIRARYWTSFGIRILSIAMLLWFVYRVVIYFASAFSNAAANAQTSPFTLVLTNTYHYIAVSGLVLLAAGCVAMLVTADRLARRLLPWPTPRCPECRYDISDADSHAKCPECGVRLPDKL